MLPLVRYLQKNDKDYRPGTWFTGSKWFKSTYTLGFRNLVGVMVRYVGLRVARFFRSTTESGERVRKIVKEAAKQSGLECKCSHWFFFTRDKVQCTCTKEG